jgi:hypothetical protein
MSVLSINEAAQALGVSANTVRRRVAVGDLPGMFGGDGEPVLELVGVLEARKSIPEDAPQFVATMALCETVHLRALLDAKQDEIAALRDHISALEEEVRMRREQNLIDTAERMELRRLTQTLVARLNTPVILEAAAEPRRRWWRRS